MAIEKRISPANIPDDLNLSADELATLKDIEDRVLWLSTLIVHHANNVRPNPDKPTKVGGHQASSASVVSIMTALYFRFLEAGDRVSVKPHASPVYHAIQYLLGNLDAKYLTMLREIDGLQSYPSQTKDPDHVDFSTGSVGVGAVAPLFSSLAAAYARHHFGTVTSNRFISLIGDAELDEGNIWEAVIDDSIVRLGNCIWIVDLNRQSLDRVIPGVKAARLKRMFAAAGWDVIEAKYGTLLEEVIASPGGEAVRERIDSMPNEEYQALIRLTDGALIRQRMADVVNSGQHTAILEALDGIADDRIREVVSNLGGHDLGTLLRVLRQADEVPDRPVVIFAYTVKGYGLPIAGDPLNHSQLLTSAQMDEVRERLGIAEDEMWSRFPDDSAAGSWCAETSRRLQRPSSPMSLDTLDIPGDLPTSHPRITSTQEAFGRSVLRLGELPGLGERVVTLSPDVATSTHLGGWINKFGVYSLDEPQDYEAGEPRMLKWQPSPRGQHVEFGISEMNLFSALGQFGQSAEVNGQPLIPIGTVYDPFICRGLDALIYGLYINSKMIVVGTPAGASLSPEGGAHQSAVTVSLGIELPNLQSFEPAFGREVDWLLMDAVRQCADRDNGLSTYLRLSTKPIDQRLLDEPLARLGEEELRRQVLAGGYRLIDRTISTPGLPVENVVHIAVGGMMVPEAVEAAKRLAEEEIAANVFVVTSPERLYAQLRASRRAQMENAYTSPNLGQLETLIPRSERSAPIVTVQDGASHSLAFMGSAWGQPVISLGVDDFGQSGARQDVYRKLGIDVDSIVSAGFLALDLVDER
jgi:pyruvate dehydrogenase E1 component